MKKDIYAAPESTEYHIVKVKAVKFTSVFIAAVISSVATSAIAVSILMQDIWQNSLSVFSATQISDSVNKEYYLRSSIDDIKYVRDKNYIEFFQSKCAQIQLYSEFIDAEIYKEHPGRRLEVDAMLEEARLLRKILVDGGICHDDS